jgi:hypothetical protein
VFFYLLFLLFFLIGEVDELQLSKEELLVVEKEVNKRMEPIRNQFEEDKQMYMDMLNKIGEDEEDMEESTSSKKKRK